MIDIRDYIISNDKHPSDLGFLYSPENSYVIEKDSNTLLKIKEYSRGIIKCENGISYCIFSSQETENEIYKKFITGFLPIQTLQKAKHYKRKKFFEDFE